VSNYFQTARTVAWRSIHHFTHNPAFLLPSLIFPLFFFVAFAGGLASVGDVPGFDFPSGYTAFQFVFVLLQASAFGGIFTGFAIAADFESGFARRLLLSSRHRTAILVGYALAGLSRAVVVMVLLFTVALVTGMTVDGGGVDIFGLVVLGLALNVTATMFSAGIALRARTIQAAPLMQTPVFLLLFLSPVYVPRDLLAGWIKTVAGLNPFTAVIEGGRGFISGTGVDAGLIAAVLGLMLAVFLTWALTGLRRAERAA
jgi:ABC-2 type transport system permease protein